MWYNRYGSIGKEVYMPHRECYTVFGTEKDPKIQFYHEVVSPKNLYGEGDDFAKLHTQDYYELSFFISGKRRIKVGKRIYDFKGGDVFFVSPKEPHGGDLAHGALDRYRLHIWPGAFDAFPDTEGIMDLFNKERYKSHQITLGEEAQKNVYHYLSEIDNSIKLGRAETRNISALADIIKLLAFLLDLISEKQTMSAPKNKLLLSILSFIESAYDSVSVEEIEMHFSISHATLWRLFQKELSTSPSAYILDIRLKKAKIMLSQGFGVQTVSDQCGFCDCSYFIKKFKGKYGVTPYKSKF